MRSKGLVLFFIIALAVVSLYQYLLVIPTNGLESDAKAHAKEALANNPNGSERAFYAQYLDQHSNDTIFSIPLIKSYTYTDLKKSQLALGLDLKGGMSVLLQINLQDVVKSLSGDSKDPAFVAALDKAKEMQKTSREDYITLFAKAYQEGGNGQKLASIFGRSSMLKDKINFSATDEQVTQAIREKANGVVNETYKRLKERIDKLGVVQPNVSLDANRDIILVELPGIDNPARARKMLESSANLEFWRTYRMGDEYAGKNLMDAFATADKILKVAMSGDSTIMTTPDTRKDTTYSYATDSLGNVDSTQKKMVVNDVPNENAQTGGPLLSRLSLFPPQAKGAALGVVKKSDIDTLKRIFERPDVKSAFHKIWHSASLLSLTKMLLAAISMYYMHCVRNVALLCHHLTALWLKVHVNNLIRVVEMCKYL